MKTTPNSTPQQQGRLSFYARMLEQLKPMAVLVANEYEGLALAEMRSEIRAKYDQLDAEISGIPTSAAQPLKEGIPA